MVKALSFKGDKKPKKRKRAAPDTADDAEPSGQRIVRTKAEDDEAATNDDSWVSSEAIGDVVGPIMIVLPTDEPSALACDQNGAVFALPIENIVDGNPTTAEPHDVRMVWIANRITGEESFRFKGHHGRYLSCDKIGQLSAHSEAVSPLECWNAIPTADTPGTFQLQTQRETFLSITSSSSSKKTAEIRGDADSITFNTTLRLRMQARFKPRIKASKEEKALSKISRKELEDAAGRRLEEDEVKSLKRARKDGTYHETLLDIKVKGKHDKWG